MIISESNNINNVKRVDINYYRRGSFSYEVDCSIIDDFLEEGVLFSESGYIGYAMIKTKLENAEDYTSVLTFNPSDIELVDKNTDLETPNKIILTKSDIDLPAARYHYDIFLLKEGSYVPIQYGIFEVEQNITDWGDLPAGDPELQVFGVYATDDDNWSGSPNLDGVYGNEIGELGVVLTVDNWMSPHTDGTPHPFQVSTDTGQYEILPLYGNSRINPIIAVGINKAAPIYVVVTGRNVTTDTPLFFNSFPQNVVFAPIYNQKSELEIFVAKKGLQEGIGEQCDQVEIIGTGNLVNGINLSGVSNTLFCETANYSLRSPSDIFAIIADIYLLDGADTAQEVKAGIADENIFHYTVEFQFIPGGLS